MAIMLYPGITCRASLYALLILMIVYPTTSQEPGGLFPPIQLQTNLASQQTVTATSTCSSASSALCEGGGGCAMCNSTCPFGRELPPSIDLFEAGTAAAGVVSIVTFYSLQLPNTHACMLDWGTIPLKD